MKIEIRETKQEGVVQVTTLDERWYINDEFPDLPFPSMTWISGCYPKGIPFYKWLAEKGWDESQSLKEQAGKKGSRVHHGIEILLQGNTLSMTDSLPDNDGQAAEPSVEEWESLMAFVSWFEETKPEIIATEQVVMNKTLWFAGTLDFKCKINDEIWIVDWKTGQNIWPEYNIQLSGYKSCEGMEDVQKLGILQIGYRRNKKGWKFTEIEDKPALLQAALVIWQEEHGGEKPRQKDYPKTITLNIIKEA